LCSSFRCEKEARLCYDRFHQTVCVSDYVRQDFCRILDFRKSCRVLYNTVESDTILTQSAEEAPEFTDSGLLRLVAVGTLKASKGYERLLRIIKRLRDDGFRLCLYILGTGSLREVMEQYIEKNGLSDTVKFLGYQTNPYKYVSKCDLFVCASFSEGFSTAATEALIVGTPVCTVEVSGMKEMLGEHNEWGIVTENDEEALYQGIKGLLEDPSRLAYYKEKAIERGKDFSTEETVRAVEEMLLSL